MSKQLNAEQKTVGQIFTECKKAFLIPEYQRPYSWERDECRTLWDNLYEFAFPNDTITDFDADEDNYFMGTILFFKNRSKEYEIIDGQQRIVTFMLMLRAFYQAFGSAQDEGIKNIRRKIEQCIWKVDEDDKPDKESLKLKYEVIADEEAAELKKILITGSPTDKKKNNYSVNYRLFKRWIEDLNAEKTGYLIYFVRRILNNCVLLPIETDSQNTALRIFTTLNDRGRELDDADIFKAQFYKFYLNRGSDEKDKFVARWKDLTELCNKNFHPRKDTPIDDLFRRYMYYLLAESKVKNDTFPDMRDYYEKDSYAVLNNNETFEDLITLARFWDDVINRNEERFSPRVLRQLYILNWAPYNIWAYVVSIYFMGNRELDEEKFFIFLNKITAMLLMYAITNPGVQAIRRPFFVEFQNILHGRPLEFNHFKQDEKILRERMNQTNFSNQRAITGSMLAWWTFQNPAQELPPLGVELQIEHILAKKRQELHNVLENPDALEFLGNKSLLEKNINIRAADYRIVDKKIFYLGDGKKAGTFNLELRGLAETRDDFTEEDIIERNEKIFEAFVEYLRGNDLLL
ncbi:MAG: DUF262 domain-containing protein [Selenomonadaceae bacterium]|nr:DUF262 domain-containing protein [Selenomonadaceae bacterium]